MFSVDRIGAEAADIVSGINPSAATFKDSAELFSLQTNFVNQHDILLRNLDSSGKSTPENTVERRLDCFANFCGQSGRSKNVILFYCFCVWEGKTTRWLSRRLSNEVAVSSASSSNNSSVDTDKTGIGKLSKKDIQKVTIMKALLSPDAVSSTPKTNANNDLEIEMAKKRYLEAKVSTEIENEAGLAVKRRSETASMLQSAMSAPAFQSLSAESQEVIRKKWEKTLIGEI